MARKKTRLFLGNLPQHSSEEDVRQRLQKYGTVNSIEIKHKKAFSDDSVTSTFAYVDLETEEPSIQQCLYDLRNKDWDGCYVKAELAKESFLDRLKREREQASKTSPPPGALKLQHSPLNLNCSSSSFPGKEELINRKRKISFNDDPEVLCEEDNLVSRLESFSDFWKDDPPVGPARSPIKGRSVRNIDSFKVRSSRQEFPKDEYSKTKFSHDKEPADRRTKNVDLYTVKPGIETKDSLPDATRNAASQASELKRLKALEEKSKTLKQQKDAIKNALSAIDMAKPCNKIVFNDDGDPVDMSVMPPKGGLNNIGQRGNKPSNVLREVSKQTSSSNGQLQLFDGDDDNDTWQGDFRFKKQFEGKRGKQLLEMQARFKDDERFVMDERFYESDDETEVADKPPLPVTEEEKELLEEKAKEMEILASVLGEPLQPSVSKKTTFNPMIRFDPLKPSHAKFELPKQNDPQLKSLDIDQKKKLEKVILDSGDKQRVEDEPLPVDESQFYEVASNIKELFKKNETVVPSTEAATFSLRQMFSSSKHDETTEEIQTPKSKPAELSESKPRANSRPSVTVLRGFQDSKPLAMFSKKLLRPQLNGLSNSFCKDVDVEAIKEKFSEKRRVLGRMLHKKRVVLERQQHFKQKIGTASLANRGLDRKSGVPRKSSKPWGKKRARR